VSAAAAATALGVLPVFLLGALVVQVRGDIALSKATLGLSVSAFFAVSALASVPAGRVVERLGAGPGMALGAAASAGALVVGGLAGNPAFLMAGVAIGGLANATGQVAANFALARGVPSRRQGVAFGIKQAAVPAATALAGLAVPAIALTVGWRWAYLAGALIPIGFGVWAARSPSLRAAVAPARVATATPTGRGRPDMAVRSLAVLAFAGALGTVAANTLAAFLVDATVSAGFDPARAGLLLAVGSMSSVVVRVGMGSFVDAHRFPLLTLVAGMLAVGAGGLAVLSMSTSGAVISVAAVVSYLGIWGWNGVFTLAIVRSNPSAPAAATGITQAGLYLGGVVGPTVFGLLARSAGYPAAWRVTACSAALGAVRIGLSALRSAGRGPSAPPTAAPDAIADGGGVL
jgi:MFS family permease